MDCYKINYEFFGWYKKVGKNENVYLWVMIDYIKKFVNDIIFLRVKMK